MTSDELVTACQHYWEGGNPLPWGGDVRAWAAERSIADGDLLRLSCQAQDAGQIVRVKRGPAINAKVYFVRPNDTQTLDAARNRGWIVGQVPGSQAPR